MSKDYFEDIPIPKTQMRAAPPRSGEAPRGTGAGERSIRNISSPRVHRASTPPPPGSWGTERISAAAARYSRWWLWVIAAVALILLGGVLLFAWRPTTVTIVPRTHTVVFDASTRYTAYPAAVAPLGALTYTAGALEFEDSSVVEAKGVERVEEKAHGTITVVNGHSASPVRLIKNTRFQTTSGLIFRISDSIVVPGKTASGPGTLQIEVYADAPGEEYNVGPAPRFTLPGLKSSTDMFDKVYAYSSEAFSGGFVGERPAVAPQALEAARAEIRSRLEARVAEAFQAETRGLVLSGLARTSFVSLPHTSEAGGGVRIHEKTSVSFPILSADVFASLVARNVAADAENTPVRFMPNATLQATADASALQALGKAPVPFSLTGGGIIVFQVDGESLAAALAGREKSAFETITASFLGIEEARARVRPFWSGSFPEMPDSIVIEIEEVAPAQ